MNDSKITGKWKFQKHKCVKLVGVKYTLAVKCMHAYGMLVINTYVVQKDDFAAQKRI